MKNLFLGIVVFTVLLSFNQSANAGPPCQPNTMCSENYQVTPVTQPVTTQTAKKKEPTPEEIAANRAALEKALERDHDRLIEKFSYNSKTDYCNWGSLESDYYKWLIKNADVVVDKKEYPAPAFRATKILSSIGTIHGECTTMMVVHYHKITKGDEK